MHRNVGRDSRILDSLTAAGTEDDEQEDSSRLRVFQQSAEIWEAAASVPGLSGPVS